MRAFDIEELRFAAARHALGALRGHEVLDLARRAVAGGMISEATSELATVRDPHPAIRDVGSAFEEWLSGEGIPVPDVESAIWQALRGHLARIAAGETEPCQGLSRVMDEIVSRLWGRPGRYVGDSHGIAELLGVHYAYDDQPQSKDPHDALARSLAQAWLARHS